MTKVWWGRLLWVFLAAITILLCVVSTFLWMLCAFEYWLFTGEQLDIDFAFKWWGRLTKKINKSITHYLDYDVYMKQLKKEARTGQCKTKCGCK